MNSPASEHSKKANSAYSKKQWTQIQVAFLRLADLPVGEQQQELGRLAKSDPKVHAEVASLLQHDKLGFDSNHQDAINPATTDSSHSLSPIRTPGFQVDEYRLAVPLAINSASEIWKAERIKPERTELKTAAPDKHSTVAIKFLRQSNSGDPDQQQQRQALRFAQEAHFLSRFQHRGIADFVSCGQDSDGSPYIVMQYVPGLALVKFADLNQLGIDDRLRLMVDVADAASYAHQLKIVHRDLKPDNILVDEQQRPVILDFGISKQLLGDDDAAQVGHTELNLTTTQFRPMTPAYASPEQARGDQVSAATDVHALGLILYELVSGHHPFSNTAHPTTQHFQDRITSSLPLTPSEIASESTGELHLSTLPAEQGGPSEPFVRTNPQSIAATRGGLSVKQLQRKLRGPIDAIVMKAIAKEPDQRYCSATDFRDDLLRAIESPLLAISNRDGQIRSFVRQKPIVSLATATLLSLLVGGGVGSWLATPTNEVDRPLTASSSISNAQTEPTKEPSPTKSFEEQLSDARQLIDQGSPTKAVEALGDFNRLLGEDFKLEESFAQRTTEQQNVLLRMLLGIGMPERASKLAEDRLQVDPTIIDSAKTRLLQAETRGSIGWLVGARELIEPLQADPVGFRASSDDLLLAKFLVLDQVGRKEELTEPVYQSTRTALAELAMIELDSPVSTRVAASASLRAAELDLAFARHAEAESLLQEMISRFKAADQPDHHLVTRGRLQLARIFELQNDEKSRAFWIQQCQESLQRSGEYGTPTAIEFTLDRMRVLGNSSERIGSVIESLEPWSAAYKRNPYQNRWFLRYQSESAIADEDWVNALANSNRLIEIEDQLWAKNGLDVLYAIAMSYFAESKIGSSELDPAESDLMTARATAQTHLADHARQDSSNLASVFLATASNSERPLPGYNEYQWIHLYLMHRENDRDTQFEMIVFHLDEVVLSCRPTALNMVESLTDRDDIFKATDGENAGRLVRFLKSVSRLSSELDAAYVDTLRANISTIADSDNAELAAVAREILAQLPNQ